MLIWYILARVYLRSKMLVAPRVPWGPQARIQKLSPERLTLWKRKLNNSWKRGINPFLKYSSTRPGTHPMITSSNGNIFRVTGHLCWEFTGPRWIPSTKASDAELWWFRLNKRLSKQSWGWWFETPSRPLRRHRNAQSKYEKRCFCSSPSGDGSHPVCFGSAAMVIE